MRKSYEQKISSKTYEGAELEQIRKELRERRKKECFAIVNRGELWYSMLSTEQYVELKNWYMAWLDVTDTLKVPASLPWTNKKLEEENII